MLPSRRARRIVTATATNIPEYPMARAAGCPFDPPPALRALQAQAPIAKVRLWDGSTPWLVTRYADQRALLADPRISSDPSTPGFPSWDAAQAARGQEPESRIPLSSSYDVVNDVDSHSPN